MNKKWKPKHTAGLIVVIGAECFIGLLIPEGRLLLAWLLTMAALALFSMIAGHGITGRFLFGWMINEQNRMSLSRLQMFLWTIVVLSGFLVSAMANIWRGSIDKALDIAIPENVWLAMGIGTTSLVGSPLILQSKKGKTTNKEELNKTASRLGILPVPGSKLSDAEVAIYANGQLLRNEGPEMARLSDLLHGEEVGNGAVLDLTRLQNLFFTLILVGAYAASLGNLLAGASGTIVQFPEIGAGSLALLGITHAGYLAGKAVDKQPEGKP